MDYYQDNNTDVDEHCTSDGSFMDHIRYRYRVFLAYMQAMQYEDWAFNGFIIIVFILAFAFVCFLATRRNSVKTVPLAPPAFGR